jgi:hypothetical protein
MAGRAEEQIAQKFDLRTIVARHIALYAELLARDPENGAPVFRNDHAQSTI